MKDLAHHLPASTRSIPTGVLGLALLALALVAILSLPATAPAFNEYQHGAIEDCETCHESAHTDRTPLSFVCSTCHTDFQIVRSGDVCWTCHTPGQKMSWARTDAGCLSTCHLRSGPGKYDVPFTHIVHAGGSAACTSCHSIAASASASAGSAHHTIPAPRLDSMTPTSAAPGTTVVLTGAKLSWVNFVGFGGVKAVYSIVSGTMISAVVPEGAVTGPVTVLGGGGVATSPADFTVLRPEPPRLPALTLSASRRVVAVRGRVRLTGALAPFDPTQLVRVAVERRVHGSWKAAASSSRPLTARGAYSWSYTVRRAGSYRARASATGVASPWVTFRAR